MIGTNFGREERFGPTGNEFYCRQNGQSMGVGPGTYNTAKELGGCQGPQMQNKSHML